jgi:hypothetical protein
VTEFGCSVIQNYTDYSVHCAVCVWPSDGHATETDKVCGAASLVTTLTGNPLDKFFYGWKSLVLLGFPCEISRSHTETTSLGRSPLDE